MCSRQGQCLGHSRCGDQNSTGRWVFLCLIWMKPSNCGEEGLQQSHFNLGAKWNRNSAKEHDIRLTVASLAWLEQLLGRKQIFRIEGPYQGGLWNVLIGSKGLKRSRGWTPLLAAGAKLKWSSSFYDAQMQADDRKFQAQYQFFKDVLAALKPSSWYCPCEYPHSFVACGWLIFSCALAPRRLESERFCVSLALYEIVFSFEFGEELFMETKL